MDDYEDESYGKLGVLLLVVLVVVVVVVVVVVFDLFRPTALSLALVLLLNRDLCVAPSRNTHPPGIVWLPNNSS